MKTFPRDKSYDARVWRHQNLLPALEADVDARIVALMPDGYSMKIRHVDGEGWQVAFGSGDEWAWSPMRSFQTTLAAKLALLAVMVDERVFPLT